MTPTQAQRDYLALHGGSNFTTIPAANAPLAWPTTGILVQTAGNMGLVLAGGTDNDAALVAVTAGQYFGLQAIALSPSNTAVLLGIDGIASDDGLSISGTPTLIADKDAPYSWTPTTTGGLGPYYFYSAGTALPAGLSVNSASGALYGTPTAGGTTAGIVIRVRDQAGFVASLAPFTLVVSSADLGIGGTPVLTATSGSAYTGFTVTATGGTGPYAYTVHAGALPTGVTLNSSTGAVAGTPSVDGSFAGIVIRATDATLNTADLAPFTLVVAQAVAIAGTPVTTGNQNVAYAGFTVTGSHGTAPLVYSVHAGTLPTGITLNSSTGAVAGTPTAIETQTGITIRATDAYGSFADLAPFTITVSA